MVQVYTWGKGYCGALGHGDEIERTRPEMLSSLKNHLAVQVLYLFQVLNFLKFKSFSVCSIGVFPVSDTNNVFNFFHFFILLSVSTCQCCVCVISVLSYFHPIIMIYDETAQSYSFHFIIVTCRCVQAIEKPLFYLIQVRSMVLAPLHLAA